MPIATYARLHAGSATRRHIQPLHDNKTIRLARDPALLCIERRVDELDFLGPYATRKYEFSQVFSPRDNSEAIYHTVAHKHVKRMLEGGRVCVIGIGTDAKARFRTICGAPTGANRGIVPRALEELVKLSHKISERDEDVRLLNVRVSLVADEAGRLRDVLRENREAQLSKEERGELDEDLYLGSEWRRRKERMRQLRIVDDYHNGTVSGVVVKGAVLKTVKSVHDIADISMVWSRARHQLPAATHIICLVSVEQIDVSDQAVDREALRSARRQHWRATTLAKAAFVDLGSPPVRESKTTQWSPRDRAAGRSYDVLIAALRHLSSAASVQQQSSSSSQSQFLQFRDSKLTHMLKDYWTASPASTYVGVVLSVTDNAANFSRNLKLFDSLERAEIVHTQAARARSPLAKYATANRRRSKKAKPRLRIKVEDDEGPLLSAPPTNHFVSTPSTLRTNEGVDIVYAYSEDRRQQSAKRDRWKSQRQVEEEEILHEADESKSDSALMSTESGSMPHESEEFNNFARHVSPLMKGLAQSQFQSLRDAAFVLRSLRSMPNGEVQWEALKDGLLRDLEVMLVEADREMQSMAKQRANAEKGRHESTRLEQVENALQSKQDDNVSSTEPPRMQASISPKADSGEKDTFSDEARSDTTDMLRKASHELQDKVQSLQSELEETKAALQDEIHRRQDRDAQLDMYRARMQRIEKRAQRRNDRYRQRLQETRERVLSESKKMASSCSGKWWSEPPQRSLASTFVDSPIRVASQKAPKQRDRHPRWEDDRETTEVLKTRESRPATTSRPATAKKRRTREGEYEVSVRVESPTRRPVEFQKAFDEYPDSPIRGFRVDLAQRCSVSPILSRRRPSSSRRHSGGTGRHETLGERMLRRYHHERETYHHCTGDATPRHRSNEHTSPYSPAENLPSAVSHHSVLNEASPTANSWSAELDRTKRMFDEIEAKYAHRV
ncbi:MAG: hypothetical protein MHM6MM_002158 [Cercozoa sp. M6MM]